VHRRIRIGHAHIIDLCERRQVELVSRRQHSFVADQSQVWGALERVDDYPRWWPWLREFRAGSLSAGEVWRCAVRPPAGYVVRFDIVIDEVKRPGRVAATIRGDISGRATVTVTDATSGCDLVLESRLLAARSGLRLLTRVAPVIARRGHEWVLDTGLRQFAERAL
jgi:uncharacterized protein YndB with AHSA1/START domain